MAFGTALSAAKVRDAGNSTVDVCMALTNFFTSWINRSPQDWNWLGNVILRFEHCFGCQPNRIILNSVRR